MMCLGWNTQETCKVRGQDVIPTAANVAAANAAASAECPDILWFWLAAGAILVGAMAKGGK